MFCDYPEKFIPYAQVELIHFHTELAEAGDFTEKIFKGPIQVQVRDALNYIKTMILEEKVVKLSDRAEALRFFNYPYDALEETLVNAVFHKSYMLREPVEIRLYLDKIIIINYPGPDKSIDMDAFRRGEAISRRYRNRRIGEFLKEIDLSERKSTGITKILESLAKNGSPPPDFKTYEEGRDYLQTTIYIHEGFRDGANGDSAGDKQAITGDNRR
jgi:ATP-dependent DNA helicase RecG